MTDTSTIFVEFSYDATRGVYFGSVNGGQRFTFGNAPSAPMPQALHNALEALRHDTQKEFGVAKRLRLAKEYETRPEVRKALAERIARYEAKGGQTQKAGVTSRPKRTTPLTLEDLGDL